MILTLATVDAIVVVTSESAELAMQFVEDSDYEFVGGGNAVNGF